MLKINFYLQLFLIANTSLAWNLTGTIQFVGSAPDTMLVYLPEDRSLTQKELPIIDQKDKKFSQRLLVSLPGSEFIIKNSDRISHNIFSNDKKNGVKFDIGLAQPGVVLKKPIGWEKDKIVKIGCKIHPKMRAWIAAIESSYYQIIPKEGKTKNYKINIKNIPTPLSKVRVWMPGHQDLNVTAIKGKTVESNLLRRNKVNATVSILKN